MYQVNQDELFEEERLPWYHADQFYPVRMGEIFVSKYKVVGKLGYGAYSTVWLCRDLKSGNPSRTISTEYTDWCNRDSRFVAVKVCTRDQDGSPENNRELKFYKHVSSLKSQHYGQSFIRGLFGTFEINGPSGKHLCLVHQPMHMTIHELQRQNSSKRLNKQLLNWTLFNVLSALSFLHDEANVVHTDINPSNIMLTIDDPSLLSAFEQAELEDPSPTKVIDETRTIYGSRKLGLPEGDLWGRPVLCDFGEARIGRAHKGLIQPELYRAPEVLFEMEWSWSVDIWNVAVLIWDVFEGRHLFHASDEDQKTSATNHVAEMVGYMGVPPLEYLRRSEVTKKVFDEKGHWKNSGGVVVPDMPLERAEIVLEGDEKRQLLVFVRSMLRWLPEERRQAVDLLADPWMENAIY